MTEKLPLRMTDYSDTVFKLIASNRYCMNAHGDIRPVQSYEELNRRGEGEWRYWWKIADTGLRGLTLGKIVLIKPVEISTVFLGVDHGTTPLRPILFETMVFGGSCDDLQWRYSNIEGAKLGHQTAVEIAKLARFVGPRLAMKIAGYCWRNTAHAMLRW